MSVWKSSRDRTRSVSRPPAMLGDGRRGNPCTAPSYIVKRVTCDPADREEVVHKGAHFGFVVVAVSAGAVLTNCLIMNGRFKRSTNGESVPIVLGQALLSLGNDADDPPFVEVGIKIPAGASGTFDLLIWLTRPAPTFGRQIILDAAGLGISSTNPLPVTSSGTATVGTGGTSTLGGGTTDTTVLAANPLATVRYVVNTSTGGQLISINFGAAAVAGERVTLLPGQAWIMSKDSYIDLSAWHVIGSAAGAKCAFQEWA